MTKTFLFAVILGFLTVGMACRKDDNPSELSFPYELKVSEVELQNSVRVFTHEGEVTDVATITRFIAGESGLETSLRPTRSDNIEITTDASARMPPSSTPYEMTMHSDGRVTFWTQSSMASMSLNWYMQTKLDVFRLGLNNLVEEYPIDNGRAFNIEQTTVGLGNYKLLRLPVFHYKLSRIYRESEEVADTRRSIKRGSMFNEFDPDFLQVLGPGDTVAYRQEYWRFKK